MLSYQMEKDTIDGKKTIIQNPTEKQRQEHEKVNLLELSKNNGFFLIFILERFRRLSSFPKLSESARQWTGLVSVAHVLKCMFVQSKKNVAKVGIEPQTIRFSI